MKKIRLINRISNLLIKAIRRITMKIMIIGKHTKISGFHTIIPRGDHIGHGIMDVSIHHIGIHGIGVLPFMLGIPSTRIIGEVAVILGGIMVILTTRDHMQPAIPDINEADITGTPMVLQDLEMLEQDRCIMDKPEQTEEIFFFVQPEVSAIKPEIPGQQGHHAEFHPVSQPVANRAAAGIVRASSSLVIVIKPLRQ
jgi:hypothetical protein